MPGAPGTGAPDPVTGAVESPDAEVARVVNLVVEHAVNRPTESLMVVTASTKHAERVRAAVDAAFAGRSDVADFVGRDTAEPFAVLGLEESVAESRDRVIFSLGFGLTKHGRVLSDFGDLSTPDGERLLTVGMTRARRSMVIVSSIRPSAFDEGRLNYGASTLMGILGGIAARAREARLDRQAQDARATRAERRDALVDAARAVQTVRHLAIRLHWMRMATRSPELSGQPYSSEDASTLSQDIDAARETIDFHLSVLTVIGLSDPAAAISEAVERSVTSPGTATLIFGCHDVRPPLVRSNAARRPRALQLAALKMPPT